MSVAPERSGDQPGKVAVPGTDPPVWIELEDLSDVLRHVQSGRATGANSPMTQYLLQLGVVRLSAQLERMTSTDLDGDGVPTPAVMSLLVGYDAVATSAGLKNNQMRRRWPTAGHWYADLIAYLLRPSQDAANVRDATHALFGEDGHLPQVSFGRLVELFAEQQLVDSVETFPYPVASVLETLLPHYEPVYEFRSAASQVGLGHHWVPVYEQIFATYGLRLRAGVTMDEMARILSQIISVEQSVAMSNRDWNYEHVREMGRDISLMARSALLLVVGNVELKKRGRWYAPTMVELDELRPRP